MATSVSKLLIRLQKFSSKISTTVDATANFNAGGFYIQDLSGWDSAVVQFGTITDGPITFYTTNDNGSVSPSQLLPAPEVPDNFVAVKGIDLSTKGDVLVASNDSIVEFGIIGKYLSLAGDVMTYPLSYAYVLSVNPYVNIGEAYNVGLSQGTRIVYASTGNQGGVTEFFADSRLTQPVSGNGSYWYGFRLLSNPAANTYACTISPDGAVSID
jgi:hypothetical protein